MSYITVTCDVDIDLSKIDTDYLEEELQKRNQGITTSNHDIENIWREFRGKECPKVLSDYIWNTIGKIV